MRRQDIERRFGKENEKAASDDTGGGRVTASNVQKLAGFFCRKCTVLPQLVLSGSRSVPAAGDDHTTGDATYRVLPGD